MHKMFSGKFVFATIVIGLALPSAATAQSGLKSLQSYEKSSCYQRTYSPSHLRKHPKQTVSHISVINGPKMANEALKERGEIVAVVRVKFKDSSKTYITAGGCEPNNGELHCAIDCDGGLFKLAAHKGKNILLKTGKSGFRVVAAGGCDSAPENSDMKRILYDGDDKSFLLTPAPIDQCQKQN